MNEDLKKDAMENIKNTLKGCDNESTRAPYWMIVDYSPFYTGGEEENHGCASEGMEEKEDQCDDCQKGDIEYCSEYPPVDIAAPSIDEVASRITGPFFSREDAQKYLDRKHYNFSDQTKVYCHSGWESEKYLALCDELKL